MRPARGENLELAGLIVVRFFVSRQFLFTLFSTAAIVITATSGQRHF